MRSGYEYAIRDNLRERGIKFGYESEVLEYKSRVRSACCDECGHCKVSQNRKYTPDFVFDRSGPSKYSNHGTLYVEAKGRLTSKDRSKMRAVKSSHPDKDIRFLFQKRSAKQADDVIKWAEKNGFPWAIGIEVPGEWL